MKPENKVKLDEFKRKVKICFFVVGVLIVIAMIVAIGTLAYLLHTAYIEVEEKSNSNGCLNDGETMQKQGWTDFNLVLI
jgi:hypothetical protein